MKPQTTTMEIDIRKMSVGGSLHCSIEEESVITFVAITTAVRLTSSYLQHQCAPSHTSTATGITLIPDTMKRAPQCQLNALRPDRGGGPDRVGEDSETGNRLKGSDVCLRHMLSLLFFFFSPEIFIFFPRNSCQRARPGQKTPLWLEETEHVAPLKSEVDAALGI